MAKADRTMDVDPWAVVLRHSRWYLLGWSHTAGARRVLRVNKLAAAEPLPEEFMPPAGLDALRTLEEHLSQGWAYPVEVLVDATVRETSYWVPRSMGLLEPADGDRTLIRATTDNPGWYAGRLAAIEASFRVLGGAELQRATAALGRRLMRAAGSAPGASGDVAADGGPGRGQRPR
jgi:predicted DNA-binding transcriptional regulator YafY